MQNTVILRGRDLFGTTVVDNRFISELVPDAPENAVRVYLYGLMLAGGAVSSPVSISDALKLSDAQVAEAFRYWEKCGIVRIIDGSLLSIEYLNLSASLPDKRPVDNENAHYSKLVQRLQAVLGTRNMSGAELQKIYDWVEIFGFEDDAALLIVQHCIEKKGARVHINYMDSVAKRLVSEGRTTADSVAESFSMENDLASGAAAILKRWRNSRLPTEDELELYKNGQPNGASVTKPLKSPAAMLLQSINRTSNTLMQFSENTMKTAVFRPKRCANCCASRICLPSLHAAHLPEPDLSARQHHPTDSRLNSGAATGA